MPPGHHPTLRKPFVFNLYCMIKRPQTALSLSLRWGQPVSSTTVTIWPVSSADKHTHTHSQIDNFSTALWRSMQQWQQFFCFFFYIQFSIFCFTVTNSCLHKGWGFIFNHCSYDQLSDQKAFRTSLPEWFLKFFSTLSCICACFFAFKGTPLCRMAFKDNCSLSKKILFPDKYRVLAF